jgi:hypothetical protein
LRDLGQFAIRHHSVLTMTIDLELRRPPSDSKFSYFFHQVDVAALCAAIREWTTAQIPGGAEGLDKLVCDGKSLRGSIEHTAGGGSAFIAQVTLHPLYWAASSRAWLDQGPCHIRSFSRRRSCWPALLMTPTPLAPSILESAAQRWANAGSATSIWVSRAFISFKLFTDPF